MSLAKLNSVIVPKIMSEYRYLVDAIINSNAIIAGGSLLSIYDNSKINDIDIYVNLVNLKTMIKELRKIDYHFLNDWSYIVPPYDNSFFKQNNILGRFVFTPTYVKMIRHPHSEYIEHIDRPIIDIIVVKNNINLTSVVSNFDLTFCKILFDGNSIKADNPDDIVNKSGSLGQNYLNKLYEGNNFTIGRILKYVQKGFSLTNVDVDALDEYSYIASRINYNSINANMNCDTEYNISDWEEYTAIKIYSIISRLYNYFHGNNLGYLMKNLPHIVDEIFPDYEYKDNTKSISIFAYNAEFDFKTIDSLNQVIIALGCQNVIDFYMELLNCFKFYVIAPIFLYNMLKTICKKTGINYEQAEKIVLFNMRFLQISKHMGLNFDETSLPNEYFDIIEQTNMNIMEIMNENPDMILIICKTSDEITEHDIMCYDRSRIESMITSKSNHFYKCNGAFIPNTNDKSLSNIGDITYVSFPINDSGMNGFFNSQNIEFLINPENGRVFYIAPHMVRSEDGKQEQQIITHSIDWQNAYGPIDERNFVGSNHCQYGSSIAIYEIIICANIETCVLSLLFSNTQLFDEYRTPNIPQLLV